MQENDPQGLSVVPQVEPQNGARRPLGGGPTTPLGVQQSPPGMYAAPVPPVQAPVAQVAPAQALTPTSAPPWVKPPEALPPLDPNVRFGVIEGLRQGATAEQILEFYRGHVVYEQLELLAQENQLEIKRLQTVPAETQTAAAGATGAAPARARDRIVKDKHYPIVASYMAKGVRDVSTIATELNITEKATEKAIAAIDKSPAKYGLASAPAASLAPTVLPVAAAPAVQTPEELAFAQWVPAIGQSIPGTKNVLPDKLVCDKIRAAGLDITWSDLKSGWEITERPTSSFVPRETTTEKPLAHPEHIEAMERSAAAGNAILGGLAGLERMAQSERAAQGTASTASTFGAQLPASIQRAVSVLTAVRDLAIAEGYSFDEIEAAGSMLAAQG